MIIISKIIKKGYNPRGVETNVDKKWHIKSIKISDFKWKIFLKTNIKYWRKK